MKPTRLESWINRKIYSNGRSGLLRSDLESYQLDCLKRTIRLAREKSRFYANRLANAPAELTRLEDLSLFPFTTADDLREHGSQLVCVPQGDIQRVVTLDTSGTTGAPKRLYFTREDQELTIDFFHQGMSTFTKVGDRVMIMLPHERPGSVGDLLAIGVARIPAIPVCYGPLYELEDALATMLVMGVNVIVGAPTQVLALARFSQARKGTDRRRPEEVLLSTDHVPRSIVCALQEIWGCRVFNHYGMTEMGLGGGVECQARVGYHLREADLYFEIVHPITGQPLPQGEYGEVVFTTLTRQGMPLVRYRTGDLSRFIPGQCPCGTILYTMERVARRIGGAVSLQAVDDLSAGSASSDYLLFMADLDEALFPIPHFVNFSASLESAQKYSPHGKNRLAITLVALPDAPASLTGKAMQALQEVEAIRHAQDKGELEVRIRVTEYQASSVGSLAKRVIIDKRGKEHAGCLA